MDNCKHQFTKIKDFHDENLINIQNEGIVVMCVYCGKRRIMRFDGTIEIVKDE